MERTLALVVLITFACAAPSSTEGGALRFDPSASSGPTTEAGLGEAKWHALFLDYFGPAAPASCAGDGQCHGTADGPGAVKSGFVCEANRSVCLRELRSRGLLQGTPSPLVLSLRKEASIVSGRNDMPLRPSRYVFRASDIERIETWIANGAPDD